MDQSAMNIESVEQLSVAEAKLLVPFAMDGAINVITRRPGPPKPKPSKGTRVWPMGLTVTQPPSNNKLIAPKDPGRYKLLVDLISPDGRIESYCKPITVEQHTFENPRRVECFFADIKLFSLTLRLQLRRVRRRRGSVSQ